MEMGRRALGMIFALGVAVVLCSPATGYAQTRPRMTSGTITVSPRHLNQQVVRQRIEQVRYALTSCYARAHAKHPWLHGSIVVRFTITRTGEVVRARASGMKHDVAGCVARTIATMRFPRPKAPVQVRFAFAFTAHDPQLARLISKIQNTGTLRLLGSKKTGTATASLTNWKPTVSVDAELDATKRNQPRIPTARPSPLGGSGTRRAGASMRPPVGPSLASRKSPLPVVRFGRFGTTTGLDRIEIKRALGRMRYIFRECYRSGLPAKPALAVRVDTTLVIGPHGLVTETRVTGSSPKVSECLRLRLRRLRFPRPKSGGSVKLRFPSYLAPGT